MADDDDTSTSECICTNLLFGIILAILIIILLIVWLVYFVKFDYYKQKKIIEDEVREDELRKREKIPQAELIEEPSAPVQTIEKKVDPIDELFTPNLKKLTTPKVDSETII